MTLTFGQYIAKRRRDLSLSQKEIAERIVKENGYHISPQYLNDLERERRNPPGNHLIHQFSLALDVNEDFLIYLADGLPDDTKRLSDDPEKVAAALHTFRITLRGNS